MAADRLVGGTAEDYHYVTQIAASTDNLASVHSDFNKSDFQEIRSKIISNIANTLTDRAKVNHATVQRLEENWGKSLNELNCHLHRLDSIATECRSALKSLESDSDRPSLYG